MQDGRDSGVRVSRKSPWGSPREMPRICGRRERLCASGDVGGGLGCSYQATVSRALADERR